VIVSRQWRPVSRLSCQSQCSTLQWLPCLSVITSESLLCSATCSLYSGWLCPAYTANVTAVTVTNWSPLPVTWCFWPPTYLLLLLSVFFQLLFCSEVTPGQATSADIEPLQMTEAGFYWSDVLLSPDTRHFSLLLLTSTVRVWTIDYLLVNSFSCGINRITVLVLRLYQIVCSYSNRTKYLAE